MANVKLAVIYYSSTGVNYQMGSWAKEAGESAGAEVRLVKVPELAPKEAIESNPGWKANAEATKDVPEATSETIEWADAIIFSTPTRFGNVASQMKQFIDTQGGLWASGKTVNKVVSAMSSASNPHGGQEATILALYTSLMHWGAIIVPTGYTDDSISAAGGNPYGTSATQGEDGKIAGNVENAVKHQARRTIEIAQRLKN